MKSLVKDKPVNVLLNDEDDRLLGRAAIVESRRRGEKVGKATLLRELAMPRIRELLADQAAA